MEHRWGTRVATDLKVQLFVDPASLAWGRLRNVSITGGFVETRLGVPALSTLRLTLPATRAGIARTVHAIAVRNEPDGVGVEWFDADCEVIAQLIDEMTIRRPRTLVASERHTSQAAL